MDKLALLTPKEDFRDWIVDNWEEIEDEIEKSIDKVANEYSENGENFLIYDSVDSDNLLQEISNNIKKGLLNVIDTYDCSEINEEVIRKINIIDDYVDEEIYQQVKYVNYLDLKEYISDIKEITTEVE